ncbi:hypothetical protein [Trinickia mobilis]|uniref:hypothetical protein n=1 Tax=Trinickia mobilis TaxID=2816356 RepID=UPI0035AB9D8F
MRSRSANAPPGRSCCACVRRETVRQARCICAADKGKPQPDVHPYPAQAAANVAGARSSGPRRAIA